MHPDDHTRLTSWTCLKGGIDVLTRQFPLLFGAWLVILGAQQLIDLLVPDAWPFAAMIPFVLLAPLYAGQ